MRDLNHRWTFTLGANSNLKLVDFRNFVSLQWRSAQYLGIRLPKSYFFGLDFNSAVLWKELRISNLKWGDLLHYVSNISLPDLDS